MGTIRTTVSPWRWFPPMFLLALTACERPGAGAEPAPSEPPTLLPGPWSGAEPPPCARAVEAPGELRLVASGVLGHELGPCGDLAFRTIDGRGYLTSPTLDEPRLLGDDGPWARFSPAGDWLHVQGAAGSTLLRLADGTTFGVGGFAGFLRTRGGGSLVELCDEGGVTGWDRGELGRVELPGIDCDPLLTAAAAPVALHVDADARLHFVDLERGAGRRVLDLRARDEHCYGWPGEVLEFHQERVGLTPDGRTLLHVDMWETSCSPDACCGNSAEVMTLVDLGTGESLGQFPVNARAIYHVPGDAGALFWLQRGAASLRGGDGAVRTFPGICHVHALRRDRPAIVERRRGDDAPELGLLDLATGEFEPAGLAFGYTARIGDGGRAIAGSGDGECGDSDRGWRCVSDLVLWREGIGRIVLERRSEFEPTFVLPGAAVLAATSSFDDPETRLFGPDGSVLARWPGEVVVRIAHTNGVLLGVRPLMDPSSPGPERLDVLDPRTGRRRTLLPRILDFEVDRAGRRVVAMVPGPGPGAGYELWAGAVPAP